MQTRTLKLTVAYDGTAFVGWQRQANGTSIQGLIEEVLARIEGQPVTVHGAGRTDAGVHALGQVASVRVTSNLACERYLRALNVALPDDIRVQRVEEVPYAFHARFDVRHKTYRYRLLNGPLNSPFDTRYAWHVTYPLDLEAMRAALALCVGEHDFAAFQGRGGAVASTIRTIQTASLDEAPPNSAWPRPAAAAGPEARLLVLTLTGDGFLRYMVRNLTGTLVDIGRARWPPTELSRLLATKDRTQSGPTAPPQGLFLVDVAY